MEDTGSGLAYDFLYKMDGSKLAVFQCCSLNYLKLSLPLPGGGSAVYNVQYDDGCRGYTAYSCRASPEG